jgi:hypothetical protein
MEEEIIEEITQPTRFAQFNSIEAYNAVNLAIVAFKDVASGGEYTRTGTIYEYEPNPEPQDEFYYMPALPELVEAGIFNNVQLFDSIPIITPTNSWFKADIQAYLTAKGIEFTNSMTKAQLLELI